MGSGIPENRADSDLSDDELRKRYGPYADIDALRGTSKVREKERLVGEELLAEKKRDEELAPLRKSLMDEAEFLGKRFGIGSKIGGRGLF